MKIFGKIKTIAFDLDDTLLDTSRLLIPIAHSPAFLERIKQPLPLLEGAEDNLNYLSSRYHLVLVTSGNVDVQRQKFESLSLSRFFKRAFFADINKNETKGSFFSQIIREDKIEPSQLLSIGNRLASDIREAKQLGATTCLFHYGEHKDELEETPDDHPDFKISHHRELLATCKL